MSTRTIRVLLNDPDDRTLELLEVDVDTPEDCSDLDIRLQVAAKIDQEGIYYLFDDDAIFAADNRDYDYLATVLPLGQYVDRCPYCGDQSQETQTSAGTAAEAGGRGICVQCGSAFKIARM